MRVEDSLRYVRSKRDDHGTTDGGGWEVSGISLPRKEQWLTLLEGLGILTMGRRWHCSQYDINWVEHIFFLCMWSMCEEKHWTLLQLHENFDLSYICIKLLHLLLTDTRCAYSQELMALLSLSPFVFITRQIHVLFDLFQFSLHMKWCTLLAHAHQIQPLRLLTNLI